MAAPKELSLEEIRKYMLENGCRVTNHALVKHFKRFLTHPETQNEARKQFKTYVNILATIKNENNQKFLILRKKYLNDCPSEELQRAMIAATVADAVPNSPGGASIISDGGLASPYRQPPPYKPPPEVSANSPSPSGKSATALASTGLTVEKENVDNYRECVNEFAAAVQRIDPSRLATIESKAPMPAVVNVAATEAKELVAKKSKQPPNSVSRSNSTEDSANSENKENIPRFSFSSGASATSADSSSGGKNSTSEGDAVDNPISVKEATRKFNRMASEEEAKVISPPHAKKKAEKAIEEKELPEVTLAHPKAKEWIVAMAKASYQELAKLASEHPELVKLQDPSTGYSALHWAAKHGNEDVVKLIAGTYKADVNARSNAGYTPLHLAMQFGRANTMELLCNVYKANRDLMDWSGNKPFDYSKQRTTVSASTYSKIKARRKHTEKDLGFLRIGSLNVRVKKTTEAFSNFLGVGNGNGSTPLAPMAGVGGSTTASLPHQRSHRHRHHHPHHHVVGTMRNHHLHPHQRMTKMTTATPLQMTSHQLGTRTSVPINTSKFDKLHKSWGSADNLPHNGYAKILMAPPKSVEAVKKRQKSSKKSSSSAIASNTTDSPRDSISSSNSSSNLNAGYSSMPTTPNQLRAPISIGPGAVLDSDSDSACGFGSNWSVNSGNLQVPRYA